jgi:ATP-dependent helicase/nuclease subunit B
MSWTSLEDEAARAWIDELLERSAPRVHGGLLTSSRSMEFQVRRIARALFRLVVSLRKRDRESAFQQEEAELEFGREGGSVPALEIDLGGGRTMRLRGVIDRVDFAEVEERDGRGVLVVDFKTSQTGLDFGEVWYGLSLQLLTYLAVMTENGGSDARPAVPAGAVYIPIFESLQSKSGAGDGGRKEARQAAGVVSAEWIRALDTEFDTGPSEHFGFSVNKKDRKIGRAKTSDAVPDELLRKLMDRTRRNLERLGAEAAKGKIDVIPSLYKGTPPCKWCDYQPFCRFEREINGYNFMRGLSRPEVRDLLGVS